MDYTRTLNCLIADMDTGEIIRNIPFKQRNFTNQKRIFEIMKPWIQSYIRGCEQGRNLRISFDSRRVLEASTETIF